MASKISDSHKRLAIRSHAITLALGIGALIFSLLAWRQGFAFLSNTSDDLVGELYTINRTCQPDAYWPGWPINPNRTGFALGNFSPNLALYLTHFLSCKLSLGLHANSLQTFLATGIILTLSLGYIACRIAQLSRFTSLFSAISMATAPCAFSRVGHLSLSQLWPVLPTIACCLVILNEYKLERLSGDWKLGLKGYGLGCLFGAIAFPGQDYYIIFGSAVTLACATWKCTQPRLDTEKIHEEQAEKASTSLSSLPVCSGFLTVNFLILSSKMWLWSIPNWAGLATGRLPSEQFTYGFWPLALAQSPIFNGLLLEKFKASSLPITETPFGSSGSLLILIGTIIAISTLRRRAARQFTELNKKIPQPLIAASITLLLSLSIALLCATSGGLGTLFATFVSPQLRALNRFMPYVYAPSVVVVSLWLESFFNNFRQAHMSENNQ